MTYNFKLGILFFLDHFLNDKKCFIFSNASDNFVSVSLFFIFVSLLHLFTQLFIDI